MKSYSEMTQFKKKGGTDIYRQYENPFSLEDELKEAKERLAADPENIDLAIEVHELEDRVRFAWDDNEAEAEGY